MGARVPMGSPAIPGAETVVLFILLVAVVNLGLGFVSAAYLGRRYQDLVALASESADPAESAPASPPPPSDDSIRAALTAAFGEDMAFGEEPASAASEAEEASVSPASEEEPEEEVEADAEADVDEQSETTASALPGPPDDHPHVEDTSVEGASVEQATDEVAPDARPEAGPGEARVHDLKDEIEHYHQELSSLDKSLRDSVAAPDAGTVRSLGSSLQETNQEHRRSRDRAHEAFQSLHEDEQSPGANLEEAIRQQDAQIEKTDRVIEELDCEADPGEGCRQMLSETGRLLHVSHNVRDALEETSACLNRAEPRRKSLEAADRTDSLTNLSSRTELEAALAEWWEKDPHGARQLTAAVIDIDQFARLNEDYGPEACDRILRATARLLKAESRGHTLAARFSGQRFFLLFADVDLRFTSNVIERIRQTIEMSRFRSYDGDIRMTVSCGVVQAAPDDTSDALYARAEATLREAKRYGRNRTFIHEGKYPTPVVPPNFALKEKSVSI